MTDEELAKELFIGSATIGSWATVPEVGRSVWISIARRARELVGCKPGPGEIYSGPTPEELAVIGAADRMTTRMQDGHRGGYEVQLEVEQAVRRLRESQAPKPRFTVGADGVDRFLVFDSHCNGAVARTWESKQAEKIADALNQAEPLRSKAITSTTTSHLKSFGSARIATVGSINNQTS